MTENDMMADKFRSYLEEEGLESHQIEEIMLKFSGAAEKKEDPIPPDSGLEQLQLALDSASDWRNRASLAARIISRKLDM